LPYSTRVDNLKIEKESGEVNCPYAINPRYSLNIGDVLKLVIATGVGYGDPFKRPAVIVNAETFTV
jgi:N-methylhydantoinase B